MLRERICPEKRQERLNAIRNQSLVCTLDKCNREFKQRTQLADHSLLVHAMVLKHVAPNSRPVYKSLDNFYLRPTSITKKAIEVFTESSPVRLKYFHKLARNPTRRKVDLDSIKNVFFNSLKPKTNALLGTEADVKYENTTSKRPSNTHLYVRPMTPQSPSQLNPGATPSVANETGFNTSSNDNESLNNISNMLSIDCRASSTSHSQSKTKKHNKHQNNKNSNNNSEHNGSVFKFSGECLSPSPSPTPSPSSKASSNSSSSLSVNSTLSSSHSNVFKPCVHKKKSAPLAQTSPAMNNKISENVKDILYKYLSPDEYPGKLFKKQQQSLVQPNDTLTFLTNTLSSNGTALNHVDTMKELVQKKFIRSKLIYFKTNRAFR